MARILYDSRVVPLHLAEGDIAMPQRLMFTLLVVLAVGFAIPLGHSETVRVKHVLTQMPVEGHLTHGGTFAGRLTVEELTVNDLGQLTATGVLIGTATSETGSATPIPPRTVITRVSLLDLRGTCTTLILDVEPLFLEPLGQEVTLVPITLDMHAVPQDQHLLGTTLCALARLQEE
jgi:hypothetical protein